MVYARLNITRDHMFDDVLLNIFYPEQGAIPKLSDPTLRSLRRVVFRGSVGSTFGKQLRWAAETKLEPYLAGTVFSRNQLMNESADWYLDHFDATTDILHEYFVVKHGAVEFLRNARTIIRSHHADLLNVTVREVETDNDTFLKYADRPMIALVMFFSQRRTAAADRQMQQMTQNLIDAALHAGGRYYLPYRLHASTEQFQAAYTQSADFFRLKHKYDPRITTAVGDSRICRCSIGDLGVAGMLHQPRLPKVQTDRCQTRRQKAEIWRPICAGERLLPLQRSQR
jgi:hypothetical protein